MSACIDHGLFCFDRDVCMKLTERDAWSLAKVAKSTRGKIKVLGNKGVGVDEDNGCFKTGPRDKRRLWIHLTTVSHNADGLARVPHNFPTPPTQTPSLITPGKRSSIPPSCCQSAAGFAASVPISRVKGENLVHDGDVAACQITLGGFLNLLAL